MQRVYLLLLVAGCQGFTVQKQVTERIPKPEILVLTALDLPSLQVEWRPVKSVDETDPVIGYKIKVWELPAVKTFNYIEVGGEKILVEDSQAPNISGADTPPEKDAKEIVVSDPLASQVLVPNIKPNVVHEVRVRAFTKRHDGPLSSLMRLQLLDNEKPKKEFENEAYKFV